MTEPPIDQSFRFCRGVARREAKNFYYAFRVLPRAKRDAICAVYAFMRRADDIADDESTPVERRREEMARWLADWRMARAGGLTEDPVFVALRESQRRFGIADTLLEDLVRGTSMDLEPAGSGPGQPLQLPDGMLGYRTFADLYHYCYLVASVVGLVCIRIFGYTDPAAELLAEKTGVAFQLTNILRDVKEDAERGRMYLPQDLLQEFAVTDADVLELCRGRELKPGERAMIEALSVQAWEYYAAARHLLPMIDRDSRAALWVLVEIYSGLLKRIDARDGDVFSLRVSVPTRRKLLALLEGVAMSVRAGAGSTGAPS